MKLNNIYKSPHYFLLYEKGCFYFERNCKKLYLNGEVFFEANNFETISSILFLDENHIIIRDKSNFSLVLNVNSKEIYSLPSSNWYINKVLNGIIYYEYNFNKIEVDGHYSWKQKRVILESKDFFGTQLNDNLSYNYNYSKNSIALFNYIKKIKIWNFSIEQFPSYEDIMLCEQPACLERVLGIYNNLLWAHVKDFRLIALDIFTGKLVHYFENLLIHSGSNSEQIHFDEQKGIITIFSYDDYKEFDLNTLSFKREIKIELGKKFCMRAFNIYPNDSNLYFSADDGAGLPNIFGIFDRIKGEITWHDKIQEGKRQDVFYNAPQVNQKYFAILGDSYRLYVYERN